MIVFTRTLSIRTVGRSLHDVTATARDIVKESRVTAGLCSVFVRHTSASMVIQENADPAVLRDLEHWLEKIAPEDEEAYEHDAEGLDDMPAHLRSAVTRTSESIPVVEGALLLGTWQAIYLWEHRRGTHRRDVVVTVLGQ